MPRLKNWHMIALAAAAGAIICASFFMAWRAVFPPQEIPMDNKYVLEKQKLETEHQNLQAEFTALADSNTALLDTIKELRKKPAQIHHNHEANRAHNWALDDSTAFALLHARLAAEDTYRLRFVYHLNAN